MSRHDLHQVLEVCQEALARPEAERDAYLDAACGADTDLRQAVAALLAERTASEGFLAQAAWTPARAPLAAGTPLGPYTIEALIGAGGMGDVYRARDPRLDRSVAIKVLPAEVSADPARRARFEREAKAIAALSHPHICTLHDVGAQAPATGAGPATLFLVMEHLEGETLARRLARATARPAGSGPKTPVTPAPRGGAGAGPPRGGAPLPLEETLRIGAELAEALAAAHKAGIVHRDLKPANVMLTATGVKVLDFGLARLQGGGGAAGAAGRTTRTPEPLTETGMRLGTVPYMAPEQVDGKEADARSDLFALGAMLYEMATGRRAFEGDTTASVAAAILDRQPPPISAIEPLTPAALEHVVTTCLAKDPEARWQAASDVARHLRWIAEETRAGRGAGADSASSASAAAALASVRRRWNSRLSVRFAAAVAVVAAITATIVWLALGRQTAPANVVRRQFVTTSPAEGLGDAALAGSPAIGFNRPSRTALAMTPEGRLVFAGWEGDRGQLYVKEWGEWEAKPIPDTDGGVTPFLSPDGQWVGFWALTREPKPGWVMKKVPLDGGLPSVAITTASQTFGASWGDDDNIVFAVAENGGLWRVPASGGSPPQAITTPKPGEYGHRLPHVLPGARAVLFTVTENVWDWESARVVVHRLGTDTWDTVVRGAADARYLRTGHLIYFRRGQLMAAPFDLANMRITGNEQALVSDVMQSTNGRNSLLDVGAAQATVSATGTLAYVVGGQLPNLDRRLIWVDRHGKVEPLSVAPQPYQVPRLSPDGSLLAVHTVQSERRIWVHDPRVPNSLWPVTTPDLEARHPVWADNGERLVFGASPKGRPGLYWARADGTEPAELLLASDTHLVPASWTPDGNLLYLRPDSRTPYSYDIWLLSRNGGKWTGRALLDSTASERDAQVSPDGRWIAYASTESGFEQVYVRRFPDLASKRQASRPRFHNVLWARTGRELFYVQMSGENRYLMAREFGSDGGVGPSETALFRLGSIRTTGYNWIPGFDVTPDGQRFIFTQLPESSRPPVMNQIHIVQHWFEELKAKVPTER